MFIQGVKWQRHLFQLLLAVLSVISTLQSTRVLLLHQVLLHQVLLRQVLLRQVLLRQVEVTQTTVELRNVRNGLTVGLAARRILCLPY